VPTGQDVSAAEDTGLWLHFRAQRGVNSRTTRCTHRTRTLDLSLDNPEDPQDLTAYPGGWWEGVIMSYDPRARLFELLFEDDDGDEWILNLPLHQYPYDPYFDPMSEPAPWSWY